MPTDTGSPRVTGSPHFGRSSVKGRVMVPVTLVGDELRVESMVPVTLVGDELRVESRFHSLW